jgi:thiol-disulfide isomerase/thioredoxin
MFTTKKYCLFFCFFLFVSSLSAIAQRDTSNLKLVRQVIVKKFFLQTTPDKIKILDSLLQEFPDTDSGAVAEQYNDLRATIATDYYKAGDKPSAEQWLNRIHTKVGKCKAAVNTGELLLQQDAKGNAPAVANRLQPMVDSVSNAFRKNGSCKEAYNFMMPVYIQTLLIMDKQDKIAYYLQPLYKANGQQFPSDVRTRVLTKPEDYKLTDNLSYNYGKALAATGHAKEAIDVWSHLYLTGNDQSAQLEAGIKAECAKLKGGTAYFQHITDSVHSYYKSKLNAFAAAKVKADGKPVDFASLKGKYVLLDFWGSWCRPCRASHPHLKELYAKYKDKGFEIIGIALEHSKSLDDDRKTWQTAIEQDGLTWMQVLDNENLDKFNSVQQWEVTAFPTKILLDRDGNIIGRYVGTGNGSAAFGEKLEELLGKQ